MRPFWIFALLVLAFATFGCPGLPELPVGGEGEAGGEGETVPGEEMEEGEPEEGEGEAPEEGEGEEIAPPPPEPGDPQEMLEHYITVEMMDKNGAVRNEYANGRLYVLAKSTGQMMEYALLVGNKELFDKEFEIVKTYFLDNDYGLPYASIWADDYSPRETSAKTEDSMRILWALYKAEDKWGTGYGYKEAGREIADQLLVYAQYLTILSKGVEWDETGYTTSRIMSIDDLRWEVMQELADEDPLWRVAVVKTNQQFLTCQDGSNGLFWQEYDIAKSRPQYPEGKDTCLTSHMLRGGMYYSDYKTYVPATTLHNKMKIEWENKGKLSKAYRMEYLGTGTGEEDMETYALAGRNAIRLGDCGFAETMLERILLDQVGDQSSPIYGSVSQNREDNGVEDDIDTLLLMEELRECNSNR